MTAPGSISGIWKCTPERYESLKPISLPKAHVAGCGSGTAYIAILKAIDEYLLNKGLTKDKLPRSVDAYRKAIQKYLAIHNGKLQREFEILYDELHIAGYYRGELRHVDVIKAIFKASKIFIEKIK